jgi:hypothetical protein
LWVIELVTDEQRDNHGVDAGHTGISASDALEASIPSDEGVQMVSSIMK